MIRGLTEAEARDALMRDGRKKLILEQAYSRSALENYDYDNIDSELSKYRDILLLIESQRHYN